MLLKLAVPALEATPLTVDTHPKQVKEWLESLPLANTVEAARSVRDGLATINRHKVADDQRLKLLELYRTTILDLLPAIEELYSGLPLPLPDKSRAAANLARELLTELAYGYKIVLLDLTSRRLSFGVSKHLPLAVQRAVSKLGKTLVICYRTYAPTPAGIWSEMHQLYRFAVEQGIQDEPVAEDDSTGTSSINLAYKQALLLALADPYRLMQGEVGKTAEYLHRFGNQAHLLPLTQAVGAVGVFLVQLESDRPPRSIAPSITEGDPRTDILLNTLELARLLHHQITRLEAGDSYRNLNLPESAKDASYIDLLRRLIRHWGTTPKRHFNRTSKDAGVDICAGIRAIHFFLSRDMGAAGESAEEGSADITLQVSGSPLEKTSKRTYAAARWTIVNESAGGLALSKVTNEVVQIRVGDVIGIKPEKSDFWNIGSVRWVQSDNPQHMELGIQMLAPTATPVAIKPTIAGAGEAFQPALLLPELPILKQPATLLAPQGMFQELREFDLQQDGNTSTVRATRLLDQTASYDLFQFG